ncbi:RyR domain-containing protein [Roseivivax sp. CAU 1753]
MNQKAISVAILIGFGLLALLSGVVGWHLDGFQLSEAVYRAFMVFHGADLYLTPPNIWISIARWVGLVTFVSAILGLLLAVSLDVLRDMRIRFRRGHTVVIGVDDFAVSYALAMSGSAPRITITDTAARLSAYTNRDGRSSILKVAVNFLDDDKMFAALGWRPELVVFGDPNPARNLERATRLHVRRPRAPIVVCSDDHSLNAEMGLWSPSFSSVPVIGSNLFSARALITDASPLDLARARCQSRPHVAIVGVNDMALTLVEEIALRCHAPDLDPVRVTLFDKDPDAAARKIDLARPGLRRAVDLVGPLQFDGLACALDTSDRARITEAAEALPLTALMVCTGSEAGNMEIALRLRRMQLNGPSALSAPILIEAVNGATVAPEPITDLTCGLYTFGGKMVRASDIALEHLQLSLGEKLHEIWSRGATDALPWAQLDQAGIRTNTRAALQLIETLKTLGFTPPSRKMVAPVAVMPAQIDKFLDDMPLLEELARTEHERWVAERCAEGWIYARDRCDRKKHHPLLVSWAALDNAEAEKGKDRNNVTELLRHTREAGRFAGPGSRWRRRIRVGALGPLRIEAVDAGELRKGIQAFLTSQGLRAQDCHLEVVSPNAPGFDRVVPAVLARVWERLGGTLPDLLLVEASTCADIDRFARDHVNASVAQGQTLALDRRRWGRRRRIGLPGHWPGSTDVTTFLQVAEAGTDHVFAISDLVIVAHDETHGAMVKRGIARDGGATAILRLISATYSAGAPIAAKS